MTDHDQHAAIGELTKRYSDAKRKRAALIAELGKVRESLQTFARALQTVTDYSAADPDKVPRMAADYPAPAVVAELLSDLTATCHDLVRTQRLLKDAGVDVS